MANKSIYQSQKSVSSEGQIVYLVRPNNVSSKAKSLTIVSIYVSLAHWASPSILYL